MATSERTAAVEAIKSTLEERVGEYFRPGSGTWPLNSADLARVVGEMFAAELERLIDEEAVNVNEGGYRWRGIDIEDLRRRAAELRGEGKDTADG